MCIVILTKQQALESLDRLTWKLLPAIFKGDLLAEQALITYNRAAIMLLNGAERKFASCYAV